MGLFSKSSADTLKGGIEKEYAARFRLAKEGANLDEQQEKLLLTVLTLASVVGQTSVESLVQLSDGKIAQYINSKVNPVAIFRFSCLVVISLLNRRRYNDSKYNEYNGISVDWVIQALSNVLEVEREYFDNFLSKEIKEYPDDPTGAMHEQDFYLYSKILNDDFNLQDYIEKNEPATIITLEIMSKDKRHKLLEGFDQSMSMKE